MIINPQFNDSKFETFDYRWRRCTVWNFMTNVVTNVIVAKKALKQCYEYMANPDFLKKALMYEINDVYVVKIADMFQEFSRCISHLAVDNYLHEVVMPGIP